MNTKYYALITDLHVVEPDRNLVGMDTAAAVKKLVATLQQESIDLSGIICLGDIADTALNSNRGQAVGNNLAYAQARDILSVLNLPIFAIPGNHDDPLIMSEYFPSLWDSSRDKISVLRSLDFDLIGIDLRTGPEPTGFATQECLLALDEALTKSPRAILFSHYPLCELDNFRIEEFLSTKNRVEIQHVIQKHSPKILAAFHGHLHLSITAMTSGTFSYGVPSPSFSFKLEPQSSDREMITPTPGGYYLLGIRDSGAIIVRPRFV